MKLSVQEIAAKEGVSDDTVRRWIRKGLLPAYDYPGRSHDPITRVDLEERYEMHLRPSDQLS